MPVGIAGIDHACVSLSHEPGLDLSDLVSYMTVLFDVAAESSLRELSQTLFLLWIAPMAEHLDQNR